MTGCRWSSQCTGTTGGGTCPREFEFGTELIVSPVLEPADQAAGRAKAEVWLPVGQWFDFFDGRRYVADNPEGRTLGVWRTLDRIPVFAKAGGIIPMQRLDGAPLNDVSNPSAFDVLVFPGADGTFTLWEDDGESVGGEWASTRLTFDWVRGMFTVHALDGDSRWCRAHAHGVSYCEVWNSRTAICRHRSLYAMAVGQSEAQSTMTRIR